MPIDGESYRQPNFQRLTDDSVHKVFYDRTVDAINRYNPDLIYFDVTGVPFYPISDAGLKIAAHFYNHNMVVRRGISVLLCLVKFLPMNNVKLWYGMWKGDLPIVFMKSHGRLVLV